MNKSFLYSSFILALIHLVLFFGCTENNYEAGDSDIAGVALYMSQVDALPQDIEFIDLLVTGKGMDDIEKRVALSDLEPDQEIVFDLTIPAGNNRGFYIEALNKDGFVAYEGEQTHDLLPGIMHDLRIDLYGRGYFYGNVYLVDPVTAQVDGPLANHQQAGGEVELSTDGNGYYEVKLETRSDPYKIEIEAALSKETGMYAIAKASLEKGGDRVKIDFYLVPKEDYSRPWICAMIPDQLAQGDTFSFFGKGFKPFNPFLNPTVVFDPGNADLEGANQVVIDDKELMAEVPAGAVSGNVAVSWAAGPIYSNFIPFTLLD